MCLLLSETVSIYNTTEKHFSANCIIRFQLNNLEWQMKEHRSFLLEKCENSPLSVDHIAEMLFLEVGRNFFLSTIICELLLRSALNRIRPLNNVISFFKCFPKKMMNTKIFCSRCTTNTHRCVNGRKFSIEFTSDD